MWIRSAIANLSDQRLSDYLTKDVFNHGGVLIGLAQLAFLIFSSIQCKRQTDNIYKCNGTLYSQTGLGGVVAIYTIIKIISGIAPKHLVEKYIVPLRKIVTLDLNLEEKVQTFGLLISAACCMYLLGSYGADGDFRDDPERDAMVSITFLGGGSLVVTAAWTLFVIRAEMRHEEEHGVQQEAIGDERSTAPLLEASSFWHHLGTVITTFQSATCIAGAVTMDAFYKSLATTNMPFVVIAFIISTLSAPRRRDPKTMWKLRLRLVSWAYISQAAWVAKEVRRDEYFMATAHILRAATWTVSFHWGLKIRAAVGRLPDKGEPRSVAAFFACF